MLYLLSAQNMVPSNKYKHLIAVAKKIIKQFNKASNVQAVLLNGSLAWGCKEKLFRSSDIDLDIVTTDKSIPKININLGEDFDLFRRCFSNLYNNRRVDYASWKARFEEIKIGLHFIPFNIFRYICSFPFQQVEKTTCLKEYRLFPKEKVPIYYQRNFQGEIFRYKSQIKTLSQGYITYTPLAIIRNGLYYNGLLPDKYLTYPIVSARSTQIHYLTFILKRNLFLRLLEERRSGLVGRQANLGNLAHARERMPRCEISHLNLETNILEVVT